MGKKNCSYVHRAILDGLSASGDHTKLTVYVDDMRAPFGRMIMCHMIADTNKELLEMADKIGIARKWIQHKVEIDREHFDISLAKRALAVKYGAKEIDGYDLVEILNSREILTYNA